MAQTTGFVLCHEIIHKKKSIFFVYVFGTESILNEKECCPDNMIRIFPSYF